MIGPKEFTMEEKEIMFKESLAIGAEKRQAETLAQVVCGIVDSCTDSFKRQIEDCLNDEGLGQLLMPNVATFSFSSITPELTYRQIVGMKAAHPDAPMPVKIEAKDTIARLGQQYMEEFKKKSAGMTELRKQQEHTYSELITHTVVEKLFGQEDLEGTILYFIDPDKQVLQKTQLDMKKGEHPMPTPTDIDRMTALHSETVSLMQEEYARLGMNSYLVYNPSMQLQANVMAHYVMPLLEEINSSKRTNKMFGHLLEPMDWDSMKSVSDLIKLFRPRMIRESETELALKYVTKCHSCKDNGVCGKYDLAFEAYQNMGDPKSWLD
ncbi:MAG: hypothetical protein V1729_01190 [Candidatus Woesearchaeota archaeon]